MPLSDDFIRRIDADCLRMPDAELRGMPAVIDTNVVLDLIFWHDKHADALAEALAAGRITALRDRETVLELAEVLSRPHFLGSEEKALAAAADWCARTHAADEITAAETGKTLTVRCRDPLDQKFLVLAVSAGAGLLVTKDKLVLKAGRRLKRFGITTIRPDEFSAFEAVLSEEDGSISR
ncbi:MAG: putative toxin-antitoxin system toxin component, PIN family [Sutterella sp.]